jgi:hypothetical protein
MYSKKYFRDHFRILRQMRIIKFKILDCFENECDWRYDRSRNIFDLHCDLHNRKTNYENCRLNCKNYKKNYANYKKRNKCSQIIYNFLSKNYKLRKKKCRFRKNNLTFREKNMKCRKKKSSCREKNLTFCKMKKNLTFCKMSLIIRKKNLSFRKNVFKKKRFEFFNNFHWMKILRNSRKKKIFRKMNCILIRNLKFVFREKMSRSLKIISNSIHSFIASFL